MKQVVTVRNLTIGEGVPKICVPIIESTEAEIIAKAEEIMNYPADLIEWRADYFEDAYNPYWQDFEKSSEICRYCLHSVLRAKEAANLFVPKIILH